MIMKQKKGNNKDIGKEFLKQENRKIEKKTRETKTSLKRLTIMTNL